jgi:hypothetical protein
MIHALITNRFYFSGGGVKGGLEKKEKELKEKIDMKVSTKFKIIPSTNG